MGSCWQAKRSRGRVETDFFERFMECIHESLEFVVGKFCGTTGSWFVVDDILERLETEPFETAESL